MNHAATLQDARERDSTDPLRAFRARFALPRDERGREVVYLSGHSLGLAPLAVRELLSQELDEWSRLAVQGHEHARHPGSRTTKISPRDSPP
jgi:kynureninase